MLWKGFAGLFLDHHKIQLLKIYIIFQNNFSNLQKQHFMTFLGQDSFFYMPLPLYVGYWQNSNWGEAAMNDSACFIDIPKFGSLHSHFKQTSSLTFGPQQSPPSQLHSWVLLRCGTKKISKFWWKFYFTKSFLIFFKIWHFLD